MSKHQRGNKEAKKPKQAKPGAAPASPVRAPAAEVPVDPARRPRKG